MTTEMLALAERLNLDGKTNEAETVLQDLIETSPELDPAYHLLGLIAYEAGNLALALELISKAVEIDPLNGLYQRNQGELYRRLGRLDEAIASGRRASEMLPLDVDTHYNLGLAFFDRGAWSEAIDAFKRVLMLKANHGLALNNLGAALVRCGNRTEAMPYFLKATQSNPDHLEALLNLAVLYRQEGRLNEARRCIERVELLAPGSAAKQSITLDTAVHPIAPPMVSIRDTGSAKGRGCFAEKDFEAGELVEAAPVVLQQANFAALPPEIKTYVFHWGALCGIGRAYALALGYGGLYNHDNPANMRYEADPANLVLRFLATRNIAAGEELTINYNNPSGTQNGSDRDWFAQMKVKPIVS